MSILQCLLIIAAFTSLLVTGPSLVPVQSHYAAFGVNEDGKSTKGYKDNIHKDVSANSEKTNQHSSQDNLCYRSPTCKQANEEQQVEGMDNTATGFNDRSENTTQTTISKTPGNDKTLTPMAPGPAAANLNVCKEVVDSTGRNLQPSNFTFTFSTPANPGTFQGNDECSAVTVAPGQYEFSETGPAGISFTTTQSGDCSPSTRDTFTGSITAGETQTCTVTNTVIPPSTLTVNKHVECNFTSSSVACPTADKFIITVSTSNGSSLSFDGSESATALTINPPFPVTFQTTEANPTSGFVISTIPVGALPLGIEFNPNNGFMYVANQAGNTVSVINPATNTVVATIPLSINITAPRNIEFNPNNGFMYVTNAEQGTVSVINPATNTVVATIPLPGVPLPWGIEFNPDNGHMYVANQNGNTVSVINPATNAVTATIPVGTSPIGIAFNPDNGHMYVANNGGNTVSVINPATNAVVATIPVGISPIGIAFNPDNGFMYVTNFVDDTVSVINPATNTVTATVPVGLGPTGIAFNPDNGFMYVANQNGNTVSVINPTANTAVGTISVGLGPHGIAFNPNNGFLYVANQNGNTVSVIAPRTTTFSDGCNGAIDSGGQTATCTVTNAYGRPT